MTRTKGLTLTTIWCCDDHAGWPCRASLPSIALLADHIANTHHQYYSKKDARKEAKRKYQTQLNDVYDDIFYSLGFTRCISSVYADSLNGHFVRPEDLVTKYDCRQCVARKEAEAAWPL